MKKGSELTLEISQAPILYFFGIVAAFYRLFDMGTTTNNRLGDLAGTVLVSRLEDKWQAKHGKKAINVAK